MEMMDTTEFDPDDDFVSLLAVYDERLAAGDAFVGELEFPSDKLPDGFIERFQRARNCVHLLELAWPRSQPNELGTPNTVGRFQIIRELGRGGFGIVYLAFDDKLERPIALKVQRPEAIISPELRKRFINEGRTTASLRHPNIAAVHEVGEAGLRIWSANEYCDAGSLGSWLPSVDRKRTFQKVAEVMVKLADAIGYAHKNGVLHRDLKPANVLLQRTRCIDEASDDEEPNLEPKLIDFGFSKVQDGKSSETRAGAILGTPSYMAPEQAAGQLDRIGPTTDVYGLGAILYELLTGCPPFCGDNDVATLRMVAEGHLVQPRRLSPTVPRDLEAICLKCLQTEPKNRYLSAAALAADLRRFLSHQPTIARPLSPLQQLSGWIRRQPALAGLVAVILMASMAFLALTAIHVMRLNAAHQAAHAALTQSQKNADSLLEQEHITNQYLYASRMKLAFKGLEWGEVDNVAQLLAAYDPRGHLANLRGFEWFHLKHRSSGDGLTLPGHDKEAYSVAFSPSGEVLVSGGQDGLIKFWNPVTGREVMRIAAHESCVNSVAFSPDGHILASASCDHTIKLWEASTRHLLATLNDHPSAVECVVFAPGDNETLASCGNDPVVRIWNLATHEVFKTLDTHQTAVRAIAWAPGGKTLLVGGAHSVAERSTACTWNIDTGQIERYQGWQCNAAIASPTSGDACFGLSDASIRVVQPAPRQAANLQDHHAGIESLAFSPDGRWLASGSNDATIRIWDFKTSTCLKVLNGHRSRVQSLAFDPHGVRLASASFDGTIMVWNLNDLSQSALEFNVDVRPTSDLKKHVTFSSDLAFVAGCNRQDQVRILRTSDGSIIHELSVLERPRQLAFLAANAILTGLPLQSPRSVNAWDVLQQRKVGDFTAQVDDAGHFEFSGDGSRLITVSQQAVRIFETTTGRELTKIERPGNAPVAEFSPSLTFSPDRNHVAISVTGGEHSWIIDLQKTHSPRPADSRLRGISNRAEMIVVEQSPISLGLVSLDSGRQLATFRHSIPVQEVAFSPDSKSVATCCADGSVHLCNVATGERLTRLANPFGRAVKVQFSADSRKLGAVIALESASASSGEQTAVRVLVWNGLDREQPKVEREVVSSP